MGKEEPKVSRQTQDELNNLERVLCDVVARSVWNDWKFLPSEDRLLFRHKFDRTKLSFQAMNESGRCFNLMDVSNMIHGNDKATR